jgi:hypothetical protein
LPGFCGRRSTRQLKPNNDVRDKLAQHNDRHRGETTVGGPAARADAALSQAYALAGSVFSLLDGWMDKGMKADPKEMDDLFHRIAWTGLAAR